jgi:transcriptional regulator with XRE-family HTH domain
MIRVYLYKNLLFLRKKNGWTQAEMQDRCGISTATWSNYENAKTEPDIQTIIEISRIFKVSIDDLLTVNLENAHLNEDFEGQKNAHQNAHLSAHLNTKNKGKYTEVDGPENVLNDPSDVGTWALMGQIKGVDEKLDQLRLLVEKVLKK